RNGPSLEHKVIAQGNKGDHYAIISESGDWIQIQLNDGRRAFVAGWIVSTSKHTGNSGSGKLKGKTIVIDPGHGGKDSGALGDSFNTVEKNLTLGTAQTLTEKLRNKGAHVILTKSGDTFISLNGRVDVSESNQA